MKKPLTPAQIAALPYRPCVGIMLANPDGKVFVGQRRDRDHDAWQMPQGGIDPGENPTEAALRELWEETGVTPDLVTVEAVTAEPISYDLPVDIVPTIWGGRYRGQAQFWVLMRYMGRDDQINIVTAHPEFSRWEWSDPGQLVDRIVPFKRAVYEQVMARFQSSL